MAKLLDCKLEVIKFDFQSHYYVHFRIDNLGKGPNPLPRSYELNSIITVLYKDGFSMK